MAREYLKDPPAGHPRYETKTRATQLDELTEAVEVIEAFVEALRSGDHHLTQDLAARLRSLVYWYGRRADPKHDPLLLRPAAGEELPLPVYGSLAADGDEHIPSRRTYHYRPTLIW